MFTGITFPNVHPRNASLGYPGVCMSTCDVGFTVKSLSLLMASNLTGF